MSRTSLTIGIVALLALIGAAAAWALVSGDGSGESTAGPVPREGAPASGDRSAIGAGQLRLPGSGQPIVWLRHGAEIPLRDTPGGELVERLHARTEFGSRTVLAVFRRVGQWAGVPTPLLSNGDLGWVKLDPAQLRAGHVFYSVDVDLSERRAQLRRGDRVLRSFPVTVGAPGSTTPTGRFAVTDTFRGNLNPSYGCCAVATTASQPNLPSGWLGGNRIAIHGTTGPLGVAASHGCVRAADDDVNALVNHAAPGAPVVIRQ
jgi:lipoprotein-anchoring transpeptidase ErfK/SrfK